MQFENSYTESEWSGCCPECIGTMIVHCPRCSRNEEAGAVPLANGSDYSHLVGDPAKQHDETHPVPSTGLLTDYDRILLGFGMHISWEL
jgi:hypothetical protein